MRLKTQAAPPEKPNDPSLQDETRLVSRLKCGEQEAFSELIKKMYGSMKRMSRHFVSTEATAEELIQETWLAVLQGLSKFEGRSSLKTWILGILINKAKTRGVQEKRWIPFSGIDQENEEHRPAVSPERFDSRGMWSDPPKPWDIAQPEAVILQKERMELLLAAIERLEPKQRIVVTLRDIEELESQEICHVLGISETYQRVLLHRGRSTLRSELEAIMRRS